MEYQEVIRVHLHDRPLNALALSLLSQSAPAPLLAAYQSVSEAPALRDDGPHLDDANLIAYSLQALDPEATVRADRHLQECRKCEAEVDRIVWLSQIWSNEDAIRKLEAQVRAAARTGTATRPSDANPFGEFLHALRVSLKPLLLPQVAFGEGQTDETISLEFPVTLDGHPVDGLNGFLTRKNREFYVCVKEPEAPHGKQFADREIWISLSNPHDAHPILQRKIDVGVAVLLGTGLRLTEDSELGASLLPAGNSGRPGERG